MPDLDLRPEQMTRDELRKIFRRLFRRLDRIEQASREAKAAAATVSNTLIDYAHRVTLAHQRLDLVEERVPLRPSLHSIPGAE